MRRPGRAASINRSFLKGPRARGDNAPADAPVIGEGLRLIFISRLMLRFFREVHCEGDAFSALRRLDVGDRELIHFALLTRFSLDSLLAGDYGGLELRFVKIDGRF